jgi:hypothetical protein
VGGREGGRGEGEIGGECSLKGENRMAYTQLIKGKAKWGRWAEKDYY